jgi:spore coat protein A
VEKRGLPIPDPSVVPEFFGDKMPANGTVYPEETLEARRYGLRILNALNARFLSLRLLVDDGSPDGVTLNNQGAALSQPALNGAAPNPTGWPTADFLMIGNEDGFLPQALYVPSDAPFNHAALTGPLIPGPAGRAGVIVDFSNRAGQKLILYNDALAPFPGGSPVFDYFPGLKNKNPVNAVTPPGSGPNTRVIMRFNVVAAAGSDPPLGIKRRTVLSAGNEPLLAPLGVMTPPPGAKVRQLTLNEGFDEHGRLSELLGINEPLDDGEFGRPYLGEATETPHADAEVWQIANLSADTHPIRFHLVNVQILRRQRFPVSGYKGTPKLLGAPRPPDPHETVWKDTVLMHPGEVTTLAMQFKPPSVPFIVQASPRTGGHEYVWHCHILEHEEHDMMRPLILT